ncbi:MAG: hypothetical protein IT296_04930 [Anaerolineae bacterium]|jgi:hypothetical protein|nr:hypothetical protein [Anaerolineales bacterium]MCC7511977.1 hypothetical protein [Anaerolineae bacterium]OQY86957.1 MAG: hypothetical protein B6D40_00340 [Anaerolineae bacterium UTCFX3]
MKRPRVNILSLLFDLLIDFALMGMGAVLYYHFMVYPLAPVGLSQVFIDIVGSKLTAVLIISGLPFIVGLFSLIRVIVRTGKKLAAPKDKGDAPAS